MEYIYDYILFFFQVMTIAVAILFILLAIKMVKKEDKQIIEVKDLTEKYSDETEKLEEFLYSTEYLKERAKKESKKAKKEKKDSKKNKTATGRKATIFTLKFNGSVMAEEVESLREEISTILSVANKNDEIVVNLESPGGAVHGYGLAAAQLERIRKKGIKLTVCVDKVAASGGYLMACVADKIIAAPFAIIGSIGVVMQSPNLNKVLKKNDIDYDLITAGEYKRTLTMFGENTPEAREKVQQELNEIHDIFQAFITKYRPDVDLKKVATGEHWLASQALELGLVDEISTSDEYIQDNLSNKKVLAVVYKKEEKLSKRFLKSVSAETDSFLDKFLNKKSTPMA